MTTFTTQDRQDAQRTPLTSDDIWEIVFREQDDNGKLDLIVFARAIERAHGIGELK